MVRPPHLDENIDSVLEVQKREREQRPPPRFLDAVSRFIGRPAYLLILLGFVFAWLAANSWLSRTGGTPWDPFPYPLLDGIITLAALISTTVILIAQNRQTRIEQQHTHIALQLSLTTEQKVAKIINLIEELRRDLPMVRNRYDSQAATFSKKTDALQVLSAIEEVGLTDNVAPPDGTTAKR